MRRRLLVLGLFAVALAGCQTCHVVGGTGCKGNPDPPSDAQAAGVHRHSLAIRLRTLARRYPMVRGIHVTEYGEIWFRLPGDDLTRGMDVSGHMMRDVGLDYNTHFRADVDLSDPFPLRDADPGAIDRALAIAKRRGIRDGFISADLSRDDSLDGGLVLTLRLETGDGPEVVLEAPYDGSAICLKSDSGRGLVRHCPKWRRQPPGIPAR